MNSKDLRDKLDSVESRIKQGPARAMAEWFVNARQAGHTEACIRVAKQMGAIVLTWDQRQAEAVRGRCGLNSGIVVESLHATPRRGGPPTPVVVDHYAATESLNYYDGLLGELVSTTRGYIETLETENAAMRERLSVVSADLEAYRGRYATLKSEMDALAAATRTAADEVKS